MFENGLCLFVAVWDSWVSLLEDSFVMLVFLLGEECFLAIRRVFVVSTISLIFFFFFLLKTVFQRL